MFRDGRRAPIRCQVSSLSSTSSPSAAVLQVHTSWCHIRASSTGSATRKWHHADDRDEEVPPHIRECRRLLVPQVPTSTLYSISALSPSVRISCPQQDFRFSGKTAPNSLIHKRDA
ncbi:hypothetical protein CDAR_368641 [Caerostris darwini]|uniref:Uncharacterized protein n=1 Tax=Caerostris darwini TaxID=1538125 RepID=A0AAV4WYG5_9ARAC|nr:hypothetical protein CDAR_368641 [Caerostris darwini]